MRLPQFVVIDTRAAIAFACAAVAILLTIIWFELSPYSAFWLVFLVVLFAMFVRMMRNRDPR